MFSLFLRRAQSTGNNEFDAPSACQRFVIRIESIIWSFFSVKVMVDRALVASQVICKAALRSARTCRRSGRNLPEVGSESVGTCRRFRKNHKKVLVAVNYHPMRIITRNFSHSISQTPNTDKQP
jgi:hypothetical protein